MARMECPTCDGEGSGEVQEYHGGLRDMRCPDCEGYGWIMTMEHNAKDVMERYGVVTLEGLAGECDECGEWWNPLEQIGIYERDWFLCHSCMALFLQGR